ncbi:MAG: choice-of-anchor J domain-containing protein, partial [Muribaculaceae bacterium]|nr:choice-of-anchor J domain-containing protein [Muribaculaceae bacterium]
MRKKSLLTLVLFSAMAYSQGLAQTAMPYSVDFLAGFPSDWSTIDPNDDGKNITWSYVSDMGYMSDDTMASCVAINGWGGNSFNDYLVSPQFSFVAGKSYKISAKVGNAYGSSCALSLKLGSSNSDAASFTEIADATPGVNNVAPASLPIQEYIYSATETGNGFIAFHITGSEGDIGLSIVSFAIEEIESTPEPVVTVDLPYSIDFMKSQTDWTALDNSATPGTTWGFAQYAYMPGLIATVQIAQDGYGADDYYISPAFNLEAGKAYKVSTRTADNDGGFDGKAATLTIKLGTSANDAASFSTTVATLSPYTEYATYDNIPYQECTFSVDESGVYYLAFHDVAPAGDVGLELFNFAIEETEAVVPEPEPVVPVELPYSIDFTQGAEGWATIDMSSSPGTTWGYLTNGFYYNKTWYPAVAIDEWAGIGDDYFVSPAFSIEAGKTYKISATTANNNNSTASLTLEVGTSASDAGTYSVISQINPSNKVTAPENLVADTFSYTASESGTAYFAFHIAGTSGFQLFNFAIEEIEVVVPEPVDPINVPYAIDFATENTEWTALDNSTTPGNSWVYGNSYYADYTNWYAVEMTAETNDANDYYISPAFNLEAGKTYKVSTKVGDQNFYYRQSTVITLELGTSISDAATFSSLATLTLNSKRTAPADLPTEETTFSVEESGVYHLAFHNVAGANDGVAQLFNFATEEVIPAPEPVALPYAIDFATENTEWTAIDNSTTPGNSWTYQPETYYADGYYWPAIGMGQETNDANDYYISPAFNLEAGKTYQVSTKIGDQLFGSRTTTVVTLELGTSASDASTFAAIATLTLNDKRRTPENLTTDVNTFSVEESGVYYLAFHDTAEAGNGSAQLFNFAIEEVNEVVPEPEPVVPVELPYSIDFTQGAEGWGQID